jgi:hypothetical protein
MTAAKPKALPKRLRRELRLHRGVADGNRTRTISLGICAIRAAVRPDLRCGVSASDPSLPGLMAR